MGDPGFEAIVAAYHGEIYRYLRRATGRASDADDLGQETFLRAFRAYRFLSPDANVRAWLFTIASNLFKNQYRGERRRRRAYSAVSARVETSQQPGPEGEMLFNDARTRIEAVVTRLPLKQRLAFTLRKMHDLDYEAIGQTLQCSPESARAHVFQALRKIRQSLNGHELLETESKR